MKPITVLLLALCTALGAGSNAAGQNFATGSKVNFTFASDFKDKIAVGKQCSGTIRLGDSLLKGGQITIGDQSQNFSITIAEDMEGLITIADSCAVGIRIGDSYDTSGDIVVGNNTNVDIYCGDAKGRLVVNRGSTVRVFYKGVKELRVDAGAGSRVTFHLQK